MWRINWGDAPTWLAAFFALAAGIVAYLLYQREATRDEIAAGLQRKRDEEAAQWQASLCGAWVGQRPIAPGVTAPAGQVWVVHLINGSPLPVYDVRMYFSYSPSAESDDVPPKPEGPLMLALLKPGNDDIMIPVGMLRAAPGKGTYMVGMTFRDTAGRRWRRKVTGELEPLKVSL